MNTLIKRLGNKSKIAPLIVKYFPPHRIYIELFFGAGGLFFNKHKAQYNILNDIDDDIFNLYTVIKNRKDELVEEFSRTPYSESLFKYWGHNKETDPVLKAVRFLYLSSNGYLGLPNIMRFTSHNSGKIALYNIETTFNFMKEINDVQFMCCDFRDVIKKVGFRHERDKRATLIYADPPYLGTYNNYDKDTASEWTEQDVYDLFDVLDNASEAGLKWAVSEFSGGLANEIANKRGYNVISIQERRSLQKREIEILITNYDGFALF